MDIYSQLDVLSHGCKANLHKDMRTNDNFMELPRDILERICQQHLKLRDAHMLMMTCKGLMSDLQPVCCRLFEERRRCISSFDIKHWSFPPFHVYASGPYSPTLPPTPSPRGIFEYKHGGPWSLIVHIDVEDEVPLGTCSHNSCRENPLPRFQRRTKGCAKRSRRTQLQKPR